MSACADCGRARCPGRYESDSCLAVTVAALRARIAKLEAVVKAQDSELKELRDALQARPL